MHEPQLRGITCATADSHADADPNSVTVERLLCVGRAKLHAVFLDFFTCVFCTEFAAESINNQFGAYGNPFSSTSIRNQFSQYGSQFSSFSACNEFAITPPRVYNSNRSVYYGELTINQFRSEGIKTASIVNWLIGDVCRH